MYKIAICDDDKRYRKTIREIIEHENSLPENEIRFYEYESGNELLKHTDILHELVFIDIRMPGLDGNQTALKLRNYNKDAVLIFCSRACLKIKNCTKHLFLSPFYSIIKKKGCSLC